MSINTRKAYQSALASFLLPVGGGLVIAVLVTVMASVLPLKVALAAFAGVALFVLSLRIKEPTQYWLCVYVLAVILEGQGINVAKFFTSDPLADPEWILMNLGVPPGELGLRIFPSDVLLLVLLILWISRTVARKESIYLPRIGYLFLAYLAWATASSFFKAPYIYLSLIDLVQQCKYFLFYLYLANAVDSKKVLKPIILGLMLVMLLQGSVVLSPASSTDQGLAYTDTKTKVKRASGLHGLQGTAYCLESIMPLAVMLYLTNRTRKKWLYLFVLALGMVALLLVHSRAALLGVTAGLISVAWLVVCRGFVTKRQLVIWIYALLLLFGAFVPKIISKVNAYMVARPETFRGRFDSFWQGTRLIAENPILGVGLNNSTAVKIGFGGDMEVISNQYLVVAAETGVVGLALYLSFFVCIGAAALQLSRSRDPDIGLLGIATFGVYVSLAVHILADPLVKLPTTMMWFYAGATTALRKIEDCSTESGVGEAQTARSLPSVLRSFPSYNQKVWKQEVGRRTLS